jgi:putative ABC transport system ATP-binding protein
VSGVEIRDLSVAYTSRAGYRVAPFEGFSASCADGELGILLGPSGSGKTTLLSCLAGLLRPASGTITAAGREVTALTGRALDGYRRTGVGVVFQAFNLIPSLSARENVAVPLRLAGRSWREAETRADALLDEVGLGDRRGHRPGELSGGQQQRVAIARALVHDPPVILADEPTAHLDYISVEEVLLLIRRLAAPGRVVLVATHDERFNPLADRVIELRPLGAAGETEPFTRELRAGEVLFEQGDPADHVYVVEAGAVEVYRPRPGGGDDLLATLGPGRHFGEIGPLLKLPRTASIRGGREGAVLTGMGLRAFRRRSGG